MGEGEGTIHGTVDLREMIGSSVRLHMNSLGKSVIIIDRTMDFEGELTEGF